MIERVYFGVTPDTVTGSDGFRDVTLSAGTNVLTNGDFESQPNFPVNATNQPGWLFMYSGSVGGESAGEYIAGVHTVTASSAPEELLETVVSWPSNYFRGGSTVMGAILLDTSAGYTTVGSMSTWPESGILPSTTYTATWWMYGLGEKYGTAQVTAYIRQEKTGSWVNVASQVFPVTRNSWVQRSFSYTTAATGSFATGALQVEFYAYLEDYDAVFFDEVTLRAPQYFTDVSQNGLLIWSTPTSYIKLGKSDTSILSFGSVTASYAKVTNDLSASTLYVANNILSVGGYLDTLNGVYLTDNASASIHWVKIYGTDYYSSYFTPTSSVRGNEAWWNIDDRTQTDFNVYNRMGGGGGASKNRGWVYADSSYNGHVPGVQILVGGDTPLNSVDTAAVYVRGYIRTMNHSAANWMPKLWITGSRVGGSTITPQFRVVDGNQATGKVLTSDANGYATWQTPTGGAGGGGSWWQTSSDGLTISPNDGGYWVAIGKTGASASLDVTGSAFVSGTLVVTASLQYID